MKFQVGDVVQFSASTSLGIDLEAITFAKVVSLADPNSVRTCDEHRSFNNLHRDSRMIVEVLHMRRSHPIRSRHLWYNSNDSYGSALQPKTVDVGTRFVVAKSVCKKVDSRSIPPGAFTKEEPATESAHTDMDFQPLDTKAILVLLS